MSKLEEYIEILRDIADNESMSWTEKYNLIFCNGRSTFLASLGIDGFDWYDPDISYKEDALAYINAFIEEYEGKDIALIRKYNNLIKGV